MVTGVLCFELCKGEWAKRFEAQGVGEASKFEVPYYVSRLPLTLADGAETMGYGVVDPALVAEMSEKSKIGSSA